MTVKSAKFTYRGNFHTYSIKLCTDISLKTFLWSCCIVVASCNSYFIPIVVIFCNKLCISRKHKNEPNRQKLEEMPKGIIGKFWSIINSSLMGIGALQIVLHCHFLLFNHHILKSWVFYSVGTRACVYACIKSEQYSYLVLWVAVVLSSLLIGLLYSTRRYIVC